MIVDATSFDVLPIADDFLVDAGGAPVSFVEGPYLDWSNELVRHVLEVKNSTPLPRLAPLASEFLAAVRSANHSLLAFGARLMPTGMHPFMNPPSETHLWLHDNREIYEAYDRIFNCRSHGYANLQSVHLNLSFAGDAEFARLHTAIRTILPLIPALSASSPYMDGKFSGLLDKRLDVYRTNASHVPLVTGSIIPEPVTSHDQYQSEILEPLYRQIAPLDPEGILQFEWLNARGAIARFDRSAIEIRVIDTQECPSADSAIAQLVVSAIQHLAAEPRADLEQQLALPTQTLARILAETVRAGDDARIEDKDYLAALGLPSGPVRAGDLWRSLYRRQSPGITHDQEVALEAILTRGPLARRMLQRVGRSPSREALQGMCRRLCECLESDRMWDD